MTKPQILEDVNKASKVIGKTYPLYSFVTSNPLSGYEQLPFEEAMNLASERLHANVYPNAEFYRKAWAQGEFDKAALTKLLTKYNFTEAPEFYLDLMSSEKAGIKKNKNHKLDRIMTKWLAAFLDEGLAEWQMPGKSEGFYKAWRKLAAYDSELNISDPSQIPTSCSEALSQIMSKRTRKEQVQIFTYHLASLPGWAGFINYRSESGSPWQKQYPITSEQYLGVRLWLAQYLKLPLLPEDSANSSEDKKNKLKHIWLKAWEKSWQNRLIVSLNKPTSVVKEKEALPDVQLAFCIDTRSEAIRRHVESKGNYETFGYAGFFGIAMDYQDLGNSPVRKACPPIVASAYLVTESARLEKDENLSQYVAKKETSLFREYFLSRMKNMLPSAFGYVEGSGLFYGLSLLARTLLPSQLYRYNQKNTLSHEPICEPDILGANATANQLGITLNEKVAIVKSAFDLTGWKRFAPIILFVGHGSHSANNPFASSLDCGACAASPGRHNARMLAKLANLPEVRMALANDHKLQIPDSTIFIGAEHNTTTDEIVIFDAEVPDSFQDQLSKLRSNLLAAQRSATQERLKVDTNSISIAQGMASDWGETRPEWGLAKNAGLLLLQENLLKARTSRVIVSCILMTGNKM